MGWTADHVPDQTGRVAVVTGANSGIGFETTKALADHGGTVIMACRNERRAADARERIRESVQGADLRIEELDLASLDSVADCAERLKEADLSIDLLINNAGVMGIPRRETVEGFEFQFGVNHLGHFALTGRLLEQIAPGGRVVCVSSEVHRQGAIDFEDLHGEESYGRWSAYAQSKLANVLFAFELDRRLESAGRDVTGFAVHPGYADTKLQDRSARGSRVRAALMRLLDALVAQPPDAGARPVLYAATAPDVPRRSYVGADGLLNLRGPPRVQDPAPAVQDRSTAQRLWEVSEALTGVEFELPEPAPSPEEPTIEA